MNGIQPGVQYTVSMGFYGRAYWPGAIEDSAPFLYWLTHGTKFPARAHREWISQFFLGNALIEGTYTLPSSVPALDGKPVRMGALDEAGVLVFCYRGTRDPIAPTGSCVACELWGEIGKNIGVSRGGLNRLIEKNVGHIFVVSKVLGRVTLALGQRLLQSSLTRASCRIRPSENRTLLNPPRGRGDGGDFPLPCFPPADRRLRGLPSPAQRTRPQGTVCPAGPESLDYLPNSSCLCRRSAYATPPSPRTRKCAVRRVFSMATDRQGC